MNKRQEIEEVKQECAKIIGYNTCFVCGCTKSKRGMTVHHLEYIFNDVTYKLPKYQPNNDNIKLKYYKDLKNVFMIQNGIVLISFIVLMALNIFQNIIAN